MPVPIPLPVSRAAEPAAVLRALADALAEGQSAVLATVVARHGSTPATPGQKLVLLRTDEALGTVGGGALEAQVLRDMLELRAGAPREPLLRRFELGPELGMSCGGAVEILLEPLVCSVPVLVAGAGHIGAALAPLLDTLGFRVVLSDERDSVVRALPFAASSAVRVLCGAHDSAEVARACGGSFERAALLAMTHDHATDERVLRWALGAGFAFVGGVGSRRKAQKVRAGCAAHAIAPERIEALRMPLGVEIGARTPAEIAVSIAAELVAWRRQAAVAPASDAPLARQGGSAGRAP